MSTPQDSGNQLPPVPRYGEYAPPQQQPAQAYVPFQNQGLGQQPYYGGQYGKPPVRLADVIVSIILLVFGLFGAVSGINGALQIDYLMQVEYDQFNLGEYVRNGPVVLVQAIIVVSHVLLLLISVPVTIVLIVKRKLAFWVPLTAGVLAGLIFWVALLVLIFAAPALSNALQTPPGH